VEGCDLQLQINNSGLFATFLIICYLMFMFFTNVTILFSLIGPVQQKEDFSDEQIDAFQCVADDFFHKWLDLIGYDGITNYNAMITSFWHHRTRKGGGKDAINRSKILPIARWILHLMLWRTGAAQSYFRSLEINGNLCDNNEDESEEDQM
jgi:hypothetical protein